MASILTSATSGSNFSVDNLSSDDKEWFANCMEVMAQQNRDMMASSAMSMNSTTSTEATADLVEIEAVEAAEAADNYTSMSAHFNQPTEHICSNLLEFKNNPISLFSESIQNAIIGVYS